MKALVKAEASPGLVMRDEPRPEIGSDDVLICINKTGICGTDLHIWKWDAWAQKTIPVPMVVGHEFVGEVVAVGSNVTDFFPGEVVSGEALCGLWQNYSPERRLIAEKPGHKATGKGNKANNAMARMEVV